MYNYTIKEISKNDRPMEKMLVNGVDSLSNNELLAILIGSGTRNKNAIVMADEILRVNNSGKSLLYSSVDRLMQIEGIGLSKATRIFAGLELGKRLSKADKIDRMSLTSPDSVADYLFDHYRNAVKEEFCILLLDSKSKLIGLKTVSIGILNQTLVHPREVFRDAILSSANSIILSHNHPSGDPTPSSEDILITDRLIRAGDYIGIRVLDHIVIGENKYISFKEKGLVRGL